MAQYHRSFLKWAGSKYRLLPYLTPHLADGSCLIEPFVGSGSIFLNCHFDRYILNDSNPDLIHVYQTLQKEGKDFINYAKRFFIPENNQPEYYYNLRDRFNQSNASRKKAALFIYLNRHGYNGLCRYSKRSGFNVPFGSHKNPYFPEEEIFLFYKKSKNALFTCGDFTVAMKSAPKYSIIYCDPPYVPLTDSAYFTQYNQTDFCLEQQQELAVLVEKLHRNNIKIILSNHDTELTRQLYKNANHHESIEIQRFISCKVSERKKVKELIAIYE